MRVVHVITGLKQGGAENALFRLVSNRNHKIKNTVISIQGDGVFVEKFKKIGIEVVSLDLKSRIFFPVAVFKLTKLFKKINPDIIQSWMYHADLLAGIAAFLTKKKIFWGIVNFNLDTSVIKYSTKFIIKLCSFLSYSIPEKIISCSENAIEAHTDVGYCRNKFVTIPLGIDIDDFYKNNNKRIFFRNKWGIKTDDIVLGYVARWDPVKDHDNLLAALNILVKNKLNFKCVLIGPNVDKNNIELKKIIVNKYNVLDKIILPGPLEDIQGAMSALDIHVLSSVGEAFPNVVAEAMACEIPCVVTKVGDAPKIVGTTGWVVEPSNPKELSKALIEAINEKKIKYLWEKRSNAARMRIKENFTQEKMIDSYHNTWKNNKFNQ
jgi:glycosyltransferase involved in cell wall biosynthesis